MDSQIIIPNRQDADKLAALHKASFHWSWDRSVMHQYLGDKSVLTLAAISARSQKLCGFAMTRFVADEADILTVSVDPRMRRNGIGKALCSQTLHALAQKEIKTLHLEVSEANYSALTLYRQLGFEETGRRKGYYPSPSHKEKLDAIMMQCRLGRFLL